MKLRREIANMEQNSNFSYVEYLASKQIKFATTATKIKHMLEAYKASNGNSFADSFKNLHTYINGVDSPAPVFFTLLSSFETDIKSFDTSVTGLYDIVLKTFTEVIDTKIEKKKQAVVDKAKSSIGTPDYAKYDEELKDVNIFETVLICKPNQHDRDLFKNFILVGEQVAYLQNNTMSLIYTDKDSNKLNMGISEYSKDDSLYDMICKDLSPMYEKYMTILQARLAGLDKEVIENSVREGNCGIIEDIFLNDIPTCFRKIVRVKSVWKKIGDNVVLDKFIAKPLKSYGQMNTLEFTEFLKYLTNNFKDMTAGCLKKQEKYVNWSNDFKVKSVSTWILPTEEEWKNATLPKCWDNFLTPKASKRLLARVFFYLGAIQDANNKAQQALVISDEGQTGKGTLTRLLKEILPPKSFGYITNKSLQDTDDFGLSNCDVQDNHIICISEYDGKSLCTNKGKAAIGGDTLTLNVKNRHSIQWDTYGIKFFITSNEGCVLKEHSYRRRIIPVTFKQTHKMKDNFSEADLSTLRETGRQFLNFCYKIYMTCPFKSKSGEYIVMNAEQEKQFLADGDLKISDKERLVKAFSQDEEIQDYFYVGDYEDSEDNIEFENMFRELFEETGSEDDYIESREVQKLIAEWCDGSGNLGLFDLKRIGNNVSEIQTRGKGTQWWKFLQFLKTTCCKYKTKMGKEKHKYFVGIKKRIHSYADMIDTTTRASKISDLSANDEADKLFGTLDTNNDLYT